MSNDSNERGHDTAAQAFQVGDRVGWLGPRGNVEGVVVGHPEYRGHLNDGLWLTVKGDDQYYHTMRAEDAILISRAPTPATPAPAQAVDPIPAMEAAMPAALGEAWAEWREACYRENVPPAVALITLVHHAARRGANVAVDMLATGTPPQEGATR